MQLVLVIYGFCRIMSNYENEANIYASKRSTSCNSVGVWEDDDGTCPYEFSSHLGPHFYRDRGQRHIAMWVSFFGISFHLVFFYNFSLFLFLFILTQVPGRLLCGSLWLFSPYSTTLGLSSLLYRGWMSIYDWRMD